MSCDLPIINAGWLLLGIMCLCAMSYWWGKHDRE